MNRLQKKCLIATAGFHLLLVLTLIFGSAFFEEQPKPDDTQVLDVIPANVVEAAINSGVRNPQPPAPKPARHVPMVPPPKPLPKPQPKPVVSQPTPQRVKRPEPTPTPVPPKPKVKPEVSNIAKTEVKHKTKPKPKPHHIHVNLRQVTRHASTADTRAAEAAREARKRQEARLRAIANAANAIKKNISSSTEVEMPGSGSVSFVNLASRVKSIYERAWIPPNNTSSDDANIKVSVTIGSDGHVIASRILDRSGDSRVDASVQKALDRVTFVAPFPKGAKEKQKTFIINFNLKAKRMFG